MLWSMLVSSSNRGSDRVVLSEEDIDLTHGELVERASALAFRLREAGVGTGDVVGLQLQRGIRTVVSIYGVLGAGGTAVPLNPGLRPGEVDRMLSACSPRLVLCEKELAGGLAAFFPHVAPIEEMMMEGEQPRSIPDPPADPDRPAFYLFSTGSTGRPKRVRRTHAMMSAEADQYQRAVQLGPEDIIMGVPPIFHSYGLCCVMLSCIRSGARARLFKEFQPETVMRWITRERASVLPGSPFHYSIMAGLTRRPGVDLSSLRWCLSCGAAAPEAVLTKFRDRFGLSVRQLYGASEVGSATLNVSDDPLLSALSVGTALPGVKVKVLTPEGGDAPCGQVGEVAVRSPAGAGRYEDLSEQSAESFRDGWFLSGDLGRLDSDGLLYITGRVKLHINSGGNKVDPLEVESVLEEHPAVAEAAVVGVPASHGLEIVKAAVVLKPGRHVEAEDLRAFCAERLIGYKVPRVVELRSELPRSPTGKLLRKDLLDEEA
ncbi:MAG TPA: AMP-binding protein [Candidatus Polarisedimenticolia bacterium]|jgi:long-chain acyl-CoA synthetase